MQKAPFEPVCQGKRRWWMSCVRNETTATATLKMLKYYCTYHIRATWDFYFFFLFDVSGIFLQGGIPALI